MSHLSNTPTNNNYLKDKNRYNEFRTQNIHEINATDIRHKKINATQTHSKKKQKKPTLSIYSNISTRDTVTRIQTCEVPNEERNTNFITYEWSYGIMLLI